MLLLCASKPARERYERMVLSNIEKGVKAEPQLQPFVVMLSFFVTLIVVTLLVGFRSSVHLWLYGVFAQCLEITRRLLSGQ